ncbi:MAG: hypothetical protein AAB495_00650 [Patescibacteria group bacterium]
MLKEVQTIGSEWLLKPKNPTPKIAKKHKRRVAGEISEGEVSVALEELLAEPDSGVLKFFHTGKFDPLLDASGTDFLISLKPMWIQGKDGHPEKIGSYGLTLQLQVKRSSRRGKSAIRIHYRKYPSVPALAIDGKGIPWIKKRIKNIIRRLFRGQTVIPLHYACRNR